ncbi:branched-chain amino acid transaminase [Streptomyces griseofuscus]|uniref:branched-chain amino acid transaminase n=1 Tax=Streptomyces TaxID=1883 RepID=UPI00081F4668|nr:MULTISPECIES: branched-chain amino acid transaminase [unclassified Streptomyces]MBJ7004245.1 branched-chain amino acid transaminase [Streptomyces sp. CRPSP2-6A1]MYQ89969.1 branched-chain amino acid transaminase [Streptomyces sp. SID4946]SCF57794.1 branched-chain amino acid aminotransferase [Streptomyces sp. DconLS]SCF59442.1 branched-chain amino acid aminotransferase [Streptomyces sp. LamerLS-31b]
MSAGRTAAPGAGRWVFHDGDFMPAADVRLSPSVQALQYGTGVFEGIRSYAADSGDAHLYRAHDHFTRMIGSARLLRIAIDHSAAELVGIAAELLRRNGHTGDAYLRPLAYKMALEPGVPFGVRLQGVSSALTIVSLPMGSYTSKDGISCGISSWRRIPDSSLPARAKITGAYANNALATDEATAAGYDDAIFLNQAGHVAEASTANVFLVRAGRVVTPAQDSDILEGITRDSVISLLRRQAGIEVERRTVLRSELYTADEIFLTGTGCEIVPVTALDGRPVGSGVPGPVTRTVMAAYDRSVRGRDPHDDQGWLTPVHATPVLL